MSREILITYGHDYSQPPIGRYVRRNGKQLIEFRDDGGSVQQFHELQEAFKKAKEVVQT